MFRDCKYNHSPAGAQASPQSGGDCNIRTRPAPAILPHGVVETRQTLTLESKVQTLVWQLIKTEES